MRKRTGAASPDCVALLGNMTTLSSLFQIVKPSPPVLVENSQIPGGATPRRHTCLAASAVACGIAPAVPTTPLPGPPRPRLDKAKAGGQQYLVSRSVWALRGIDLAEQQGGPHDRSDDGN